MNLALHYAAFDQPGSTAAIAPTLAATARAADEGGFDTLTVMDHYLQIDSIGPPEDPMLEAYTTLGFLAGQTRTLRLGALVTGVTYRHPGLLAKIVATLDVLSGGRAMLGIGAAWYEREHHALGVPYPPTAERFERLEETLQIVRQMWSDDDGPYQGRHDQLAETMCHPQPVQRPHPPILIGGMGERKTLRLVARYGDACNLFAIGHEAVAHRLDILKRHCETEGTDYDRIKKTIITATSPLDDVDGFLREMEGYARLGVTRVWSGTDSPDPAGWVTRVADQVVPRLREL